MKIFPYHKQETEYTCGVACMRMALEFFGIKKSEKQISRLLNTTEKEGTWNKSFPIVAENFKLSYVCLRNAKVKDLITFRKEGYIVIVGYYDHLEKTGHYSVIKNIGNKYIYFWGPYYGPNHRLSINQFNRMWKNDPKYDNEKRWFFAVKGNK